MNAIKIAAVSLLIPAFPTAAWAQNALDLSTSSAQSPVTINSCGPIINKNTAPQPSPSANPIEQFLAPATSSGMRIVFTNESGKVADLVNFEVRSNGVQFVIRDVGTFSPGITIDHRFSNGAGQAYVLPAFIPPDVKCRVLSVRFVDRTVWPSTQASSAGAAEGTTTLSASPASVRIAPDADSALVMISSTARVAGFNESDNCNGIALVFVTATAQTSVVYSIKPLAPGTCAARVTDEAGRAITIPITVQQAAL
jgi:hypothetical protein